MLATPLPAPTEEDGQQQPLVPLNATLAAAAEVQRRNLNATLAAAAEVQRRDVAVMHEKVRGILATIKAGGTPLQSQHQPGQHCSPLRSSKMVPC